MERKLDNHPHMHFMMKTQVENRACQLYIEMVINFFEKHPQKIRCCDGNDEEKAFLISELINLVHNCQK